MQRADVQHTIFIRAICLQFLSIGGKVMRRVFKQGMAVALAAAMTITLVSVDADAAKKPAIAKKTYKVVKGKKVKVKIKNGKKSAKVTWKSSNKKIAKITKKNSTSATVKGVKKGTAKISATYKAGSKKVTLKCKVKVTSKAAAKVTATTTPVTNPTVAPSANVSKQTAAPTGAATTAPTGKPKVTGTPKPTPTPSPVPKFTDALTAYKLGATQTIAVDGDVDEAWGDSYANNLILDKEATKVEQVRGEVKTTGATAKIMWADDAAYVLVDVAKEDVTDKDSVTVYFDQNEKATKDTMVTANVAAGKEAKEDGKFEAASKATATGYIVEAKFNMDQKEVDSNVSIEIQINEEKGTINVYDTRSTMVYDKENNSWSLGDEKVQVAEKPELMGKATLTKSLAQSTSAFFTADGAKIREAAELDSAEWDSPNEDGSDPAVKTKTMKFVDTSFWKDAYAANNENSIYFTNVNIPDYKGNAEKLSLGTPVLDEEGTTIGYESNRDFAEGYIVWDEDYLYVLFNVADKDISPANDDHYTTDSTEFFLDEDLSRPTAYATDGTGDEVQLRVDATDNRFSSNDAGTGNYALVGHAVNADENGYQVEYIIKLNNKHKNGDTMGMDLQINDCFTVEGTVNEETGEKDEDTADRAATLTAYDTTNNAYQDPSCFGRVKLINKDAEEENPDQPAKPTDEPAAPTDSPAPTDEPAAPTPAGNVVEVPLTDVTYPNWVQGISKTTNDDGTVTITWAKDASDYAGATVNFDAVNIEGFKYVIVETVGAATTNFNVSDATRVEPSFSNPLDSMTRYGVNFADGVNKIELTTPTATGKDGNPADYKNVGKVTFYKGTEKTANTITIKSIKFVKSDKDL